VRLLPLLLIACCLGCATARQMLALRQVEFRLDRLSDARVAGIHLDRVRSYDDVSPVDLARLAVAVASKNVPLELTVHVEGRNPETNSVTARLVAMDWMYLVDERETVSGRLSDPTSFPPGEPRDVPVIVSFNLASFFGSDGRALLNTALALTGQQTSGHNVALRITPTVDTPVGPIRYPTPITLNLLTAR
jgi:hypothetical protein